MQSTQTSIVHFYNPKKINFSIIPTILDFDFDIKEKKKNFAMKRLNEYI